MASTAGMTSEAEPAGPAESGKLSFQLGKNRNCFWRVGVPLKVWGFFPVSRPFTGEEGKALLLKSI